ncbi:agamous-like MADS-box protein AGL29 [Ananas comosus]|uniref:Agamous-like MADS-box protein AGL29 n=1 Tax=Ananas comosus TaxID=4615 RepID=A0A6P5FSA2_ANACO|nr:agamous-like MADS-box protein AGL29 [Ananas comosus]
MERKGKGSRGRKKIEMKMIENEQARHVCFSKRRAGVFTKASELSTLCGAEVAVIVFSPSGNPYSFGSPAVDPVLDRFLSGGLDRNNVGSDNEEIQKLNQEYMELAKQIEAEKARKERIDERLRLASQSQEVKWLENIDKLGLDELNQLRDGLLRVKAQVNERARELLGIHGPPLENLGLGLDLGLGLGLGLGHGMDVGGPSSSSGATERAYPVKAENPSGSGSSSGSV